MPDESTAPPPPPPQPPAPVPAETSATPDSNGQSGTAVAERPAPSRPKLDHLPQFKVLLHNDDVNDVVWVVRSIVELTPHPIERAVELTQEAHESGVALVLVTHLERAELYQDQFKSKRLTVTIEPTE